MPRDIIGLKFGSSDWAINKIKKSKKWEARSQHKSKPRKPTRKPEEEEFKLSPSTFTRS